MNGSEIMSKYIKYIILFGCLLIFCFLAINIYNGNDIVSDNIIYNFISKYIISDSMTPVIKMLTNVGDFICIGIVTIISLFVFRDKKVKISIVVNLIIVTVFNNILKLIFMRLRPDLNVLVQETGYSFPSGHSMISIVFYGYLIYLIYHFISNKKIKWLLISLLSMLIMVIGFSRIYLGVHYFSDVIGGFTFGIVYLIIYTDITKKIMKNI